MDAPLTVFKAQKLLTLRSVQSKRHDLIMMGGAAHSPTQRQWGAAYDGALKTIMEGTGNGLIAIQRLILCLDIQVQDLEGVFFNKLPSRFDLITHQSRKDQIRSHTIFDVHLQ